MSGTGGPRRALSVEQIREICSFRGRATARVIARKFQIHHDTVERVWRRFGEKYGFPNPIKRPKEQELEVRPHNEGRSEETLRTICSLRNKVEIDVVCERFALTRNAVRNVWYRHGPRLGFPAPAKPAPKTPPRPKPSVADRTPVLRLVQPIRTLDIPTMEVTMTRLPRLGHENAEITITLPKLSLRDLDVIEAHDRTRWPLSRRRCAGRVDVTAELCGDPISGRSALDQRYLREAAE